MLPDLDLNCEIAINGWFIGLQNTKITMLMSLVQNLMNIVLSLFFVFGIGVLTTAMISSSTNSPQRKGLIEAVP